MARALNINSKKAFREDLTYARSILRDIDHYLSLSDWDFVNTLARDLEGLASSIACRATENEETNQ